jgi:ParB family chromosome partitioning protein
MNELITAFPIANIAGVYEQHDARSPFEDVVQSIKNHGLWSPVVIHKESSFLITGHSRVLACTKLGKETIPAWLVDCPPGSPEARLIAIESDLVGKWFNELEVNCLMAERKKLYLGVNPETAKGVAGAFAKHGCANDTMSFAETAANNANLSIRSIERKISIGEKISPDVLDELEQQLHKHNAKHFCKSQKEQLGNLCAGT